MNMESRKFGLVLFSVTFLATLFEISSGNAEDLARTKFDGKEIIVLANQYPPIFSYSKQKNGNYSFGGLAYEIMQIVQDYLNIRYKYVVVDENEVMKNGIIHALLNRLDKKDVDIVPYMFDQDINHLKHMELVSTIWIDPMAIMQTYPEEEGRLSVAIRPFQLTVWVGFILSTAVFILITAVFIKLNDRRGKIKRSTGEIIYRQLEYVLTIVFGQGNLVPYKSRQSFKILVGIWLLSMVVLIYAYTGVMTSLLTVPKLQPIIQTLEETVQKNRLVTMERDRTLSRTFMEATEGYEKVIGDQLRKDPTLWEKDAFACINNVVHRKCIYPTALTLINYIIYEDTKSNGKCRLTVSDELKAYNQLPLQIGFPIGHPIVPAFNEFFLRINAGGIIDLYKKKFFPSTTKCRTDIPPETKTRSLTLLDMTFAFVILGFGLVVSILAFLVEMIGKLYFSSNRVINIHTRTARKFHR